VTRALLILVAFTAGILTTTYLRRYAAALTWWAFTADVRKSDPHLYGRRRR